MNPETNPEAVFERGHELLGSGDREGALRCFEEVTQLAPGHPVAYWMKGMVLCSLKRFEEAVFVTKAGLDIFPDEPGALLNFGRACIETGRLSAARVALRRSAELGGTGDDGGAAIPNALLWLGFAAGVVAQDAGALSLPTAGPTWEALHAYLGQDEMGHLDVQDARVYFLLGLGYADAGIRAVDFAAMLDQSDPALAASLRGALQAGLPPLSAIEEAKEDATR